MSYSWIFIRNRLEANSGQIKFSTVLDPNLFWVIKEPLLYCSKFVYWSTLTALFGADVGGNATDPNRFQSLFPAWAQLHHFVPWPYPARLGPFLKKQNQVRQNKPGENSIRPNPARPGLFPGGLISKIKSLQGLLCKIPPRISLLVFVVA